MPKLAFNLLVTAVLASLAISVTAEVPSDELKSLWETWKQIHGKTYAESEELPRFAVFVENYLKAVAHNAQDETTRQGLNQFSDLTPVEFKQKHLSGFRRRNNPTPAPKTQTFFRHVDYELLSLPASVDWREKGAVTPVKNQLQCGSCWSFSTTGALEGLHFIKTGKLLSFSEQQLVDCVAGTSCSEGGDYTIAFDYTTEHGIELEANYPYVASSQKFHESCRYNSHKAHKVNNGYKNVTVNSVAALKAAVAVQPVSVGIQANQNIFQGYQGGVIKHGCGADVDHAVLVVGYKKVNGEEVFIVKNSWDTTWGEDGYVYISANGDANDGQGVCGILSNPAVPLA